MASMAPAPDRRVEEKEEEEDKEDRDEQDDFTTSIFGVPITFAACVELGGLVFQPIAGDAVYEGRPAMYTDQIHTTVAEKYNIMLRWLSDIHHFHKGNKGAILAEEELFLKEVRQVEDVSNSRVFIIAHRMLVSYHVTYKLSEAVKKLLNDLHITVLMLADVSSHVVRSQELLPRLFFHIQHNPLADFEGDTMSKRLLALGQKIKKEDKIHGWDWGDEGLEVKILTEDGDGDDEPLKRWEAESYVASSLDDNDHWRPMIETFMASTLATLKVTNITKKKKALWELTFSDKTTVDMKERWIRDCGYPAWIAALETAKTSEGKDENEGEDEKKGEETGEDESEELHQAREEAEAARPRGGSSTASGRRGTTEDRRCTPEDR